MWEEGAENGASKEWTKGHEGTGFGGGLDTETGMGGVAQTDGEGGMWGSRQYVTT